MSAIHGTSASTPLIAGLVTLLNEVRLASKQPALGFINPALYAIAEDVRSPPNTKETQHITFHDFPNATCTHAR